MTPEGGEHPRTATSDYMSANQRQLDIVFDLDLGELMPGHHVVARGIERSRSFYLSRSWSAAERLCRPISL